MSPSMLRVLQKEHIASIRDIQKNPSKVLRGITRVTKGSKTVGFYLANEEFKDFLEDMEAPKSKRLKERVKKARRPSVYRKSVSLKK